MKHVQSCDEHPRYRPGCEACLTRKLAYNKRLKLLGMRGQRLSVAPGLTRERLQKLRAAGYSISQLSAATGLVPATIWRLSSETHTRWLQLGTFQAVEKAWRELHEFPAVGGGYVDRAARVAASRGWTPPKPAPMPAPISEDHVDEITVDRACRGERVPLTRAEMTAAWRTLEARGCYASDIAARLHVAERTVQRWRDDGVATNRRHRSA